MSNSVRPHRWQPTRLHPPWDSPGKNIGVVCHFLLYITRFSLIICFGFLYLHLWVCIMSMKVKVKVSCTVVSNSLQFPTLCNSMDCPDPLSMEFSRTGVGCCFLLQGIFPTWGSNPGLLHCRQILYQLNHKGSLKYEHSWCQNLKRKKNTAGSYTQM